MLRLLLLAQTVQNLSLNESVPSCRSGDAVASGPSMGWVGGMSMVPSRPIMLVSRSVSFSSGGGGGGGGGGCLLRRGSLAILGRSECGKAEGVFTDRE